MVINNTPEELGRTIRAAKQAGKTIDVTRYSMCTRIEIQQEQGNDYGEIAVYINNKHWRALVFAVDKARFIGNEGKRSLYLIPNTPEAIKLARTAGATVCRAQFPNGLKSRFVVCSKEQFAKYNREILGR